MSALSWNLRLSNPSLPSTVHCLVVDGDIMIVCILWDSSEVKALVSIDDSCLYGMDIGHWLVKRKRRRRPAGE